LSNQAPKPEFVDGMYEFAIRTRSLSKPRVSVNQFLRLSRKIPRSTSKARRRIKNSHPPFACALRRVKRELRRFRTRKVSFLLGAKSAVLGSFPGRRSRLPTAPRRGGKQNELRSDERARARCRPGHRIAMANDLRRSLRRRTRGREVRIATISASPRPWIWALPLEAPPPPRGKCRSVDRHTQWE